MIRLTKSLSAWGSPAFAATLTRELEQLSQEQLPLQPGLGQSSHVSSEPFKAMFIGAQEDADSIIVKAGIFYSGIIAGCNCADDPTPVEPLPEYCTLRLTIDKLRGETVITLLPD
jgi:hypothetical protein